MIPANLLPEDYRDQFCVAGGWAACPALANDMDVWVYGVDTNDLEYVRTVLLSHIEAENAKATAPYRRPFYIEPEVEARSQDLTDQYEGVNIEIRKVAKVEPRREGIGGGNKQRKVIHLLVTDAPNPAAILRGFDVSTHAVAIDHNGIIWKHDGWTPPQQAPQTLMSNEKTAVRMAKIAERFGHPTTQPVVQAEDIFGS